MQTETTKTTESTELENALVYFTGTEAYHKFSAFSQLKLTDGVKYLCEKAGSYWLMDIIHSYQNKCKQDEMLKDFQMWTLTVNSDNTATVICERDTDDIVITQDIPYTDFPLKNIKLYCINEIIMLTSEY